MIERLARVLGAVQDRPEVVLTIVAGAVVLTLLAVLARSRAARRRESRAALAAVAAPAPVSSAERLRAGLDKTRAGLLQRLAPLLGRAALDPSALEEIETALLAADVGVGTTERLLRSLRERRNGGGEPLREVLARQLVAILEGAARHPQPATGRPRVVMVVGVNGAGKTTTIGKLACRLTAQGERVLLVAADTFRAAAIEQLGIWAARAGAEIVRQKAGGDPGAVVYDGMRAALARGVDVAIIDTAGRLHTRSNLMEELRKVRRVVSREIPGAPHETLLVLDAVTGQNGLAQARAFVEQIEVDGVVLAKLDGTAKGGIVVAIAGELGLPIRYVGVGEGVDDLRDFDPHEFVTALLSPAEQAVPLK
jgi:fused signal recognition particle receptor